MSSAQDEFNRLVSNNRERDSVHPEDGDNHSNGDSSIHETDLDPAHNTTPTMASRTSTYTIPNTRFNANTGPKGVIADAQAFERARKSTFRKSFVSGSAGYSSQSGSTDAAALLHNSPPPDRTSDLDDADEDKFMQQWRQSRMQELQTQKARRPSPWRKYYGSVDTVDAVGYLDAIEKVPSDQVVVVCLYDPESSTSSLVEDCLKTIASRQPSIRFVKLHYEIAEMDHIEPPALLAYRDGDVFATLVDIPHQIPKGRSCSADSLEDLLKHRVL
ncbi:phosducin family protein [Aspergillus lucknowensis]|uniref:Thioredoxin-like protein n=1 Tax=Aspergillus lucknowensis TaxID=176173 RepID=A0ABR4LMT6_9EURO